MVVKLHILEELFPVIHKECLLKIYCDF